MIPNAERVEEQVSELERLSLRLTTDERAVHGIRQACRNIVRYAEDDRAAELAHDILRALSQQPADGQRVYSTGAGEKIELLREYVQMRAEQACPGGGAAARKPGG